MERTIRTGMRVKGVRVPLNPISGLAASIPVPQRISYPEQLTGSRGNPLTVTFPITLNLNDISIRRCFPSTDDAVEMTQPVYY